MEGEKKSRFDPEEIFSLNGSWLNAIEDHTTQLAKLERRMTKTMPLNAAMQMFVFQTELYRAHLGQLEKAAGVNLDPYAWDYASAYAETYATQHYEHGKSEEESSKAADRAGMIAKARAIAADTATQTKPRISRAGVAGATVWD